MEDSGLLQYVTGPVQLVGLVVLVLAGLVPRLTGSRIAQKNQRTVVLGLLALGALVVVGGIGAEVIRSRPIQVRVSGNTVNGNGNAMGVRNGLGVVVAPDETQAAVVGNNSTGDQNAVGVGNNIAQTRGTSQ